MGNERLLWGNERLLLGNERLLLGIFGVFGVFGISFFVAGGFWDSVGRGPRRGFRKYLTQGPCHIKNTTVILIHYGAGKKYDGSSIDVSSSFPRVNEYVSPQFGGSWTLESSSLCHHPTAIIALNRTDGVSYVSCLTPIPEEWLVERDWFIVNHWEDLFCRKVYQDLCEHAEFQHLRAVALLSPGTTPRVCPVDNLMNTRPAPPFRDQMTLETLAPCAWRYVLTMDDLASFRLLTRSDVVGRWDIASTTYFHFYCKVKLTISAQCFTPPVSKSGRSYNGQLSDKVDSVPVVHTAVKDL